ncbi:hypothetical protein N7494_004459 [Penicillium frequentans]|uniref:Uncharacterized protein n=1 Tax=Penicillium frequentans TaxID=3151616 RepID=A0AAD6D0V1_9EURO|nr:hypothetical protein N7494_004459 [Penicillium glabrum]
MLVPLKRNIPKIKSSMLPATCQTMFGTPISLLFTSSPVFIEEALRT